MPLKTLCYSRIKLIGIVVLIGFANQLRAGATEQSGERFDKQKPTRRLVQGCFRSVAAWTRFHFDPLNQLLTGIGARRVNRRAMGGIEAALGRAFGDAKHAAKLACSVRTQHEISALDDAELIQLEKKALFTSRFASLLHILKSGPRRDVQVAMQLWLRERTTQRETYASARDLASLFEGADAEAMDTKLAAIRTLEKEIQQQPGAAAKVIERRLQTDASLTSLDVEQRYAVKTHLRNALNFAVSRAQRRSHRAAKFLTPHMNALAEQAAPFIGIKNGGSIDAEVARVILSGAKLAEPVMSTLLADGNRYGGLVDLSLVSISEAKIKK